ncbi:FtsB family cell division protein [Actinopolymorpha singaporensis]|uniref:Cell division protein FtsB n=1 Tax=Actinopolymorpha singaporensis TaxID=117157 RepID=A0A1H1L077_9ACTN|nr:septum formation initiator family protein [Actinopolymorpha singaporensis]SDR67936.1 Cell division protein FtsB [Actinopolymorpha singaporensis]SDT27436.1 Cell division protein FtsB [Actinopolymorpha singaporensis]
MSDARGGRNARPAGRGRGPGRAKPGTSGRGTSGRGSRGGAGTPRTTRRTAGAGPTRTAARGEARPEAVRPGVARATAGTVPGARRGPGRSDATKPASRRNGNVTGRAAILALVIAALVISYASSLRAWVEQRSQIAALRTEETQRTERVASLEKELRRWHDPAYVEAQARERLRWVKPGETGYVVVGEDGSVAKAPAAAGGAAVRSGPQQAWWSSLWGSVERSGVQPTTPPVGKTPSTPKHQPPKTIDPSPTQTPRPNR